VLLNDDYTPMEFVVDVGAHFSAWTARLRPVSCSR
jgi:ATP-dependent Clp protease adapter protein ClpS